MGLPLAKPSLQRGVTRRIPAAVERPGDRGDRYPRADAAHPDPWCAPRAAGPRALSAVGSAARRARPGPTPRDTPGGAKPEPPGLAAQTIDVAWDAAAP